MRTVTGLFDTYADGQAAVRALEAANIDRDNISIVSRDDDGVVRDGDGAVDGAEAGAGLGALAGGAGGLLAGLGMLTIPGIGPVVAAGWLASTITGLAAGAVAGGAAGGIIGALTDAGVSEDEASVYAEGVRRGGTLVTARVEDALAPTAARILDEQRRVDWTTRQREYTESGWTGFDDTLPLDGSATPHSRPTGGLTGRL
jgi:hypothetical protein